MQSTRNTASASRVGKPPNILVLCDDSKKHGEISEVLKSMVANDRYAIYGIAWDELAVGGWADATALLVVSGKIPDPDNQVLILLQFLGNGGRLLAWCCESAPFGPNSDDTAASASAVAGSQKKEIIIYGSSETKPISVSSRMWGVAKEAADLPPGFQPQLEITDSDGNPHLLEASVFAKIKDSNKTVIIEFDGGALGGRAVLSRVNFEDSNSEEASQALLSNLLGQVLGIDCTKIKSPEFTDGFLLGDEGRVKDFVGSVPAVILQSKLTVELVPRGSHGSKPSQELLPVRILEEPPSTFSALDYFDNLKTKDLGRLVIYTDVIGSTMNVFNGQSLQHGIVVIARQQTSGRGRGENIWLSPVGCALQTVQVNAKMSSQIGNRLPLIQHIAALSVVLSVPNHKELNLRVKWPNDIYLGAQKIGGVLVESTLQGNEATIIIGIGVNVSNDHPTVCLNSALEEGSKLTCASFIAKCLSQMEVLLNSVEGGGLNQVLATYTDNWLHSQEDVVRVEVSGGKYSECQISGVNEFGFLQVIEINSGRVISVQPDGNSFDIANKLIAMK